MDRRRRPLLSPPPLPLIALRMLFSLRAAPRAKEPPISAARAWGMGAGAWVGIREVGRSDGGGGGGSWRRPGARPPDASVRCPGANPRLGGPCERPDRVPTCQDILFQASPQAVEAAVAATFLTTPMLCSLLTRAGSTRRWTTTTTRARTLAGSWRHGECSMQSAAGLPLPLPSLPPSRSVAALQRRAQGRKAFFF